jgi:hypothetical protein
MQADKIDARNSRRGGFILDCPDCGREHFFEFVTIDGDPVNEIIMDGDDHFLFRFTPYGLLYPSFVCRNVGCGFMRVVNVTGI